MGESGVKGQVSFEYVIIIALTFAIIIPTTYLFFNYSKDSSQEIVDAQLTKMGRGIIDSAETIFYSGEGSKTLLEINVPKGISAASIVDGRELVFNMTTDAGTSEIVFFSSVNLTTDGANCVSNACSLPLLPEEGFKRIKIEAVNRNSVSIEQP